jgi:class 3 adenylate cyclase
MVVSGAPLFRADHVEVMLECALRMLGALEEFNAEQGAKEPLFGLRVGVNCGSVVAGVVGTSKVMRWPSVFSSKELTFAPPSSFTMCGAAPVVWRVA